MPISAKRPLNSNFIEGKDSVVLNLRTTDGKNAQHLASLPQPQSRVSPSLSKEKIQLSSN